ncbi:hypothetical protein UY3_09430 [Chelonia mydas]|uniref:Uncharacterized protein n=1 Tax=Chelonia mydas TaxID=8469 RepID=M7B673_CHEMY|nr:hypothetical protein UY3_09430 [Chelonia mydas]
MEDFRNIADETFPSFLGNSLNSNTSGILENVTISSNLGLPVAASTVARNKTSCDNRPLTHVEWSSPAPSEQASPDVRMPSMPEASQAARDVMFMPVPGALLMSAPRSRGKLPLGSMQSPPAQYQSRSRVPDAVHRPATVRGRVHVDCPRCRPDCLSGYHPSGTLGIARPQKVNIDGTAAGVANGPSLREGTAVGHGRCLPARTPSPSLRQDIAALGVDCQHLAVAGPPIKAICGAAVTVGTGPPRRDRGPEADVDPGTAAPPGPETAADLTPAQLPFVAVLRLARPANQNSWPCWCQGRCSGTEHCGCRNGTSGHRGLRRSPWWELARWPELRKYRRPPSPDT